MITAHCLSDPPCGMDCGEVVSFKPTQLEILLQYLSFFSYWKNYPLH